MAVNGINRYTQIATKAQFPKNAKIDPTNNNLPNSSKDGNYPYNPLTKQATEPVTTSTSGNTSSEPVQPNYTHPQGGVAKLQEILANRKYSQQESNPQATSQGVTIDNSGNMFIPQNLLGYTTPMDAEERIKLVDKYERKLFNRDAVFQGVTQLGAALGGATSKFSTVFGTVG